MRLSTLWTAPLGRRLAVSIAAALIAGGAAWGLSVVVAHASCETGACPVGTAPWPLIVALSGVAAYGAAVGSRPVR
jgi:uncharacterized RDD family membrane protein YckC